MLKVVALGFCAGKHSYLQSTWNVLDGVLVFVSLIDILVSVASTGGNRIFGILRVLRLLRTLRPLRSANSRDTHLSARFRTSNLRFAVGLLPCLRNNVKVNFVVAMCTLKASSPSRSPIRLSRCESQLSLNLF